MLYWSKWSFPLISLHHTHTQTHTHTLLSNTSYIHLTDAVHISRQTSMQLVYGSAIKSEYTVQPVKMCSRQSFIISFSRSNVGSSIYFKHTGGGRLSMPRWRRHVSWGEAWGDNVIWSFRFICQIFELSGLI